MYKAHKQTILTKGIEIYAKLQILTDFRTKETKFTYFYFSFAYSSKIHQLLRLNELKTLGNYI